MSNDAIELFRFPAIGRKKLTAAFDGGRITSDGGVLLLAAAERRLGIAQRLARLIADPRNPLFVRHSVADILRARMLAIACGYEDGDDLDHLRTDPGFKLACGRPVLGISIANLPIGIGTNVLVAWDGSREAVRPTTIRAGAHPPRSVRPSCHSARPDR